MGLNNFYFILQFCIVLLFLAILQFLRARHGMNLMKKCQICVLIMYSYLFVGFIDWRFCVCVVFETLWAYVCGLLMGQAEKYRRVLGCAGGCGLILALAYFKYTNFFIESFNKAFALNADMLRVVLPLGISFFTFSALSYIIDVYRGVCTAETNIVDFGLYMAFFPKITAGPIVRWVDFKPQVKEYRGFTLKAFHDGIQIFTLGLFKKMVLADHLGVFVDDVFLAPYAYDTGTVILSAVSYSLQIYLDFSGYSDMAIGLAKILGFEMERNFNLPYIAKGFSDFWSRWHISLSAWFRDYLYIPLGGSQKGERKTYRNLFVVMLVSGLWHGAGWTFILWGILHGGASCLERFFQKEKMAKSRFWEYVEILMTFFFVTLFWTVFRADDLEKAMAYWRALFTLHSGVSQPYTWTFVSLLLVVIATLTAAKRTRSNGEIHINGFYPLLDLSKIWSLAVFFVFCGLTILFGSYGNTAFIYGSF